MFMSGAIWNNLQADKKDWAHYLTCGNISGKQNNVESGITYKLMKMD